MGLCWVMLDYVDLGGVLEVGRPRIAARTNSHWGVFAIMISNGAIMIAIWAIIPRCSQEAFGSLIRPFGFLIRPLGPFKGLGIIIRPLGGLMIRTLGVPIRPLGVL